MHFPKLYHCVLENCLYNTFFKGYSYVSHDLMTLLAKLCFLTAIFVLIRSFFSTITT